MHPVLGATHDHPEGLKGVAEARFGMPEDLARAAWAWLPADMRQALQSLYAAAEAR